MKWIQIVGMVIIHNIVAFQVLIVVFLL